MKNENTFFMDVDFEKDRTDQEFKDYVFEILEHIVRYGQEPGMPFDVASDIRFLATGDEYLETNMALLIVRLSLCKKVDFEKMDVKSIDNLRTDIFYACRIIHELAGQKKQLVSEIQALKDSLAVLTDVELSKVDK